MKQIYLAMLLSAATLGVQNAVADTGFHRVSAANDIVVNHLTTPTDGSVKMLGRGIARLNKNGIKRIDNRIGTKTLRTTTRFKAPASRAASEGAAFYESFEAWDGQDLAWLPEGWTRQTKTDSLKISWTPSEAVAAAGLYPSDGDFFFAINFSDDIEQDEWLITPAVDIAQDMMLKFTAYIDPVFLFSLDNVDWNTYEFIGEPQVSATLQVLAKAEGDAQWTLVRDFADDYKGQSLMELLMQTPAGLETKTVKLDGFGGKTAQIALRYVGKGGNLMAVDEVSVALPSFEGLSYMDPLCTQFWGFERGTELACFSNSVAQMPVYEPLTWTNMSWADGAEYTWTFFDPVAGGWVESHDGDSMTATFVPDYSTPTTKRNNFTFPVELKGTAPGTSGGSYTAPYNFIQAGGKFEYAFRDGTSIEGGLLPFNFHTQQLSITVVDLEKYGDATFPVFGYDDNSDNYWLDYTLNGEEPSEGDEVKMNGILNFIYPAQAPIVVNAADVFAKGEIGENAELTLQIFALADDYVFDPTEMTPMATASCKGSEILREEGSESHNATICIPFDFASPVVLAQDDEAAAFVVYLTGFNSPDVKYFAPLQSFLPDPNYMCHGWICKSIKINSDTPRFSVTPMANYTGEAGECYNAFAINLHAEEPWLTADASEVTLPSDGSAVDVALGSYYDGSKLSVEAPAGVEADVAGRYDECVLTLRKNDAAVVPQGAVKVSGPGVAVEINVKSATGIAGIETVPTAVTGIYDLCGRHIKNSQAKAGIYIIRHADGTIRKAVIK